LLPVEGWGLWLGNDSNVTGISREDAISSFLLHKN